MEKNCLSCRWYDAELEICIRNPPERDPAVTEGASFLPIRHGAAERFCCGEYQAHPAP